MHLGFAHFPFLIQVHGTQSLERQDAILRVLICIGRDHAISRFVTLKERRGAPKFLNRIYTGVQFLCSAPSTQYLLDFFSGENRRSDSQLST